MTIGLDLTRTKVEVFALAAAIAGVGGFFLAGWKGTVGKDDFSLLSGTLSALPMLLLAVVGGITAVSGAMILVIAGWAVYLGLNAVQP